MKSLKHFFEKCDRSKKAGGTPVVRIAGVSPAQNSSLFSKYTQSLSPVLFTVIVFALCSCSHSTVSSCSVREFRVSDFGAVGDGITDDGSAIAKAVNALVSCSGPARLIFESNGVYRVASLPDIQDFNKAFLFNFENVQDKTIAGNGCHLSMRFPLKLLRINRCQDIAVGDFSLAYDPAPFTQGHVCEVDKAAGSFDVQIADGHALPNFDAPDTDVNPAWHFCRAMPGPHLWTSSIKEIDPAHTGKRQCRVFVSGETKGYLKKLKTGTLVVLPALGTVDGVGQCQSGAHSQIFYSGNVFIENVRQYSSPHFSFQANYNEGPLHFKNVDIMPKEGTDDLVSSGRDGLHLKTNRGGIIVEECDMKGLLDDSLNMSAIALTAEKKIDDTTYQLRTPNLEGFPEIKPGFTIQGWNVENGQSLGPAVIDEVLPGKGVGYWNVIVKLRETLTGLEVDAVSIETDNFEKKLPADGAKNRLWISEYVNAHSIVRNNRLNRVKLRAPHLLFENNDVQGLVVAKANRYENPLVHDMVIRSNHFNYSGIPTVFSVWRGEGAAEIPPQRSEEDASAKLIQNIVIENNVFERPVYLCDAQNCTLSSNRFEKAGPEENLFLLRNVENIQTDDPETVRYLDR